MKALRRSHTSSSSDPPAAGSPPVSSWIPLRSLLVVASSTPSSERGGLKSPWSRRKRKIALSRSQWNSLFTPEGRFQDGGVKFLKKVRSGGVDPSIRAEVWPFLLAVYDLDSSESERNAVRSQKRKEYKKLRRRCGQLLKPKYDVNKGPKDAVAASNWSTLFSNGAESVCSEDDISARYSFSMEEDPDDISQPLLDISSLSDAVFFENKDKNVPMHANVFGADIDSSESESSPEESDNDQQLPTLAEISEESEEQCAEMAPFRRSPSIRRTAEDFATWQRIIRLDAVRASSEWIVYSPKQASVSKERACQCADAVGLKDYENLEPCMIYHAARLVAILESYAIYDQETGYCQGMSDLLSPILAVVEKDHEAFWCFVGFMKKARHNFRLDEVGIRRQLNIVSRIIKSKDSHLYRHLEKLQAEDCFFVYRMVVVLFRRELTFEQTVCLWEVMWADQAALRAGIGKSSWRKMRTKAPPTDDLLLYAIAACVLQRRKLIIEKYSSMDEIVRECNNMTGQLDVWKLLDDAHDLVVTHHEKVSLHEKVS